MWEEKRIGVVLEDSVSSLTLLIDEVISNLSRKLGDKTCVGGFNNEVHNSSPTLD